MSPSCDGKDTVEDLLAIVDQRDPHQPEFRQAVAEVLQSLAPLLQRDPRYFAVMKRLLEPERVIQFRVAWLDDKGVEQVNRGLRVQFNSAIGPYKGGLRFHPSVNLSIIKFLGFEQIFKNALTTLPMGGGKGGSDFDPRGKSDNEVMRFCQSYMTELYRHIGPNTDVPAGDIGVGSREVGYLFGQYKRLANAFEGILTGKGANWGGSLIRPEATGYGLVYFTKYALEDVGDSLEGKRVTVSGSGNVAQFAVQKLLEFGAVPITMSDSCGYVLEPDGFDAEKLKLVMDLKNVRRGRLSEYTALSKTAKYVAARRPWAEKCDLALPCATQNEVEKEDALALADGGCKGVFEGANMPSTPEAITVYYSRTMMYGPAKAANAGGVSVSGLEMTQNAIKLPWTRAEVDKKLQAIMRDIYRSCVDAAEAAGAAGNLEHGANIAGFLKVAESMIAQGTV